ncbi:MAG TPA: VOC family protein [Terriglobales bacterium]|jgi:PhnB protein
MQINPYLFFDGNCEEAFKFYEKATGGKIEAIMPYEGTPGANQAPPDWGKKVMHASLTIGDTRLMGSDAPGKDFKKPQGFSVALNLSDPTQAEKTFKALSDNGSIQMPIQETFWAQRFGMLTDRFGVPWMINCEKAA